KVIRMSTFSSFEDIEAWQKARELNKLIYQITSKTNFSKDFDLVRQIRRASISVSSNIAEGFERQSNKEFSRFLFIAKGSIGEVRSQMYLALDIGYIDETDFNKIKKSVLEISRMLSGLIKYLNK
ncbi:four helix bundle protein, partial [Ochrovirga pacifica]|uniref:four helix bundle protein n=1 Tax=Ochrovirga pacifica TaxID=1042376 RepID=UPI00025594D9